MRMVFEVKKRIGKFERSGAPGNGELGAAKAVNFAAFISDVDHHIYMSSVSTTDCEVPKVADIVGQQTVLHLVSECDIKSGILKDAEVVGKILLTSENSSQPPIVS